MSDDSKTYRLQARRMKVLEPGTTKLDLSKAVHLKVNSITERAESKPTENRESLENWMIDRLSAHLSILQDAGSKEEFLDASTQILRYWITLSYYENNTSNEYLISSVSRLTNKLNVGFKQQAKRPSRVLEAREDVRTILRAMQEGPPIMINGVPHRHPIQIVTLADATRHLASVCHLSLETARKRVLKAEQVGGFKLPRAAPFGKKRPPSVR